MKILGLQTQQNFFLCDASEFLKKCTDEFDLIFLDPPYNKGLITPVMELLKKRSLLKEDGIVILESDSVDSLPDFFGFYVFKQRRYGRTVVTLYKKEVEN